ncbi:hypothetical protein ABPG75_010189 [Micractinium tetrahymenae]
MRKLLAALLSPLLIALILVPLLVLLAAPFDAEMEAGPFQGGAPGLASGGSGGGAHGARRLLQAPPAPNDTSTFTNYTGIPALPLTGPRAVMLALPVSFAISFAVPIGCIFCCALLG